MKNNDKIKIAFFVGYYKFHKDRAFYFPLNRWYSMGYARNEDMEEAGKRISPLKNGKVKCQNWQKLQFLMADL